MNALRLSLALALLVSLAATRAAGDIAPNPLTGGWPVSPYDAETTDVRMVAEDVIVRIYTDSVLTVAKFSMRNEGKKVHMIVGFPFPYERDVLAFRAFVDGHAVTIRGTEKQNSRGQKTWTTYWKVWDTDFREGAACDIRVEYKTKVAATGGFFFHHDQYPSLPTEVIDTLRRAQQTSYVEYVLETGQPWQGKLDHCRVTFEFPELTTDHIAKYAPRDGVITKHGIVWEYANYEPWRRVSVEYFPNLSTNDVSDVFRSFLQRYPDDAQLASDAGRCAYALGMNDLRSEIHRSFLARWDKPIPQLTESALGGGRRVNREAEGGFFRIFGMARDLFTQYNESNDLEKGRDLAPKVSRISTAIVDSLSTCGTLRKNDEWIRDEAAKLRDLCNEMIKPKD